MTISLKLAIFMLILLVLVIGGVIWWLWHDVRQLRRTIRDIQQRFRRGHEQQQVFLGQLSHELRTPLTALIAHTAIARNHATSEPVRQASLATLETEAQRMARLVRDLLELHRLETSIEMPLIPINVALLAEEAVISLMTLAEQQHVTLDLETPDRICYALGNPDRIKQVWLNLLTNAIRYAGADATVTAQIEHSTTGIVCSVIDNGVGIAPELLPRIGQRLVRGKHGEGNGLGLALVSEILARHNTPLQIESSASGTLVWWVLQFGD